MRCATDAAADDAYAYDEGTSFAAAHVTGACALLRARFPAENALYAQCMRHMGFELVDTAQSP